MARLLFRCLRVSFQVAIVLGAIAQTALAQDLLVSSLDNGIRRYDGVTGAPKGNFISPGSGGLNGPTAFVFGPDGNLYVSSIYSGSIKRYNGVTGAYMGEFVPAGSGGGIQPYELVFGPDGNLYVANGGDFGDAGVKRFDGTTGAFIDEFIPGLLNTSGVVFGPDGLLYVTDSGAVRRYDATTGALIDTIAPLDPVGSPIAARFGPDGHLYVNYFYGHRIQRFNILTGADLGTFVPAGSGGLFWVYNIGFGPDNHLYATERYSNVVNRFDGTTGAPLGAFAVGIPGEVLFLNWFPVTKPPGCTMNVDLSYVGVTFTMNFELGTATPRTWSVWLFYGESSSARLLSVPLPAVAPAVSFPIAFPLPPIGTVGVLTSAGHADWRHLVRGLQDGFDDAVDQGSGIGDRGSGIGDRDRASIPDPRFKPQAPSPKPQAPAGAGG